jgi:hypothetical protein
MITRRLLTATLACAFATALLARAPQQGPFLLSCSTLPFETIKKAREIDDVCDRAGTATTDSICLPLTLATIGTWMSLRVQGLVPAASRAFLCPQFTDSAPPHRTVRSLGTNPVTAM